MMMNMNIMTIMRCPVSYTFQLQSMFAFTDYNVLMAPTIFSDDDDNCYDYSCCSYDDNNNDTTMASS